MTFRCHRFATGHPCRTLRTHVHVHDLVTLFVSCRQYFVFVFVRDGGKCERFAFRFVPRNKNVSETGAPYFEQEEYSRILEKSIID